MARAFLLVDALPRREQAVFEALSRIPAVVSKRMLKEKIGNADMLVLLEAADADAVESIIAGQLRGVSGVHTVRRVMLHHTIVGSVQRLMSEMADEVQRLPKA